MSPIFFYSIVKDQIDLNTFLLIFKDEIDPNHVLQLYGSEVEVSFFLNLFYDKVSPMILSLTLKDRLTTEHLFLMSILNSQKENDKK